MKPASAGIATSIILACFMAASVADAQQQGAPSTSLVPTQLLRAKTVFLSNAGADTSSLVALGTLGDPDSAFGGFVAAMKSWGHFDVASAPADADLVFEFHVESASSGNLGSFTDYKTFLSVTILDAKTHFILWTIKTPLAVTRQFGQNVSTSVTKLVNGLKSLTTPGV
jgi:hypothetical protein